MPRKYFFIFCFLLASPAFLAEQRGFVLVDKVCATVDAERPILLSEVMRRSKEMSLTPKNALHELLRERALFVEAKKTILFNITQINEDRNKHIKKIMASNNLTLDKFEKILSAPPYSTTLSQYEYELDYQILKHRYEDYIRNSIDKPQKKIIQEEAARRAESAENIALVFISITAPKNTAKTNAIRLQFIKAKKIKQEIQSGQDLNEIKKKYSGQSDVSFVGPLEYTEGSLKDLYELQLKKNPSSKITEPFEDGGAVAMILKEKVVPADKQKTALEVVKDLYYKSAVQQRLDATTNNALATASVEINCDW